MCDIIPVVSSKCVTKRTAQPESTLEVPFYVHDKFISLGIHEWSWQLFQNKCACIYILILAEWIKVVPLINAHSHLLPPPHSPNMHTGPNWNHCNKTSWKIKWQQGTHSHSVSNSHTHTRVLRMKPDSRARSLFRNEEWGAVWGTAWFKEGVVGLSEGEGEHCSHVCYWGKLQKTDLPCNSICGYFRMQNAAKSLVYFKPSAI